MRLLTLPALVIATLALSAGAPAAAQPPDGTVTASASAKQTAKKKKSKQTAAGKPKAKRRSCRKGYALRTVKVKRRGKVARVKRCRKKRAAAKTPAATPKSPAAPAPGAALPPGATKPLFDPPGRTLEGAAAQAFIERYLHDSRFTDCPTGWPSCEQPERRYSHFGDGRFFRCLLTPIPGLGSSFLSAYFYEPGSGKVRPDGSWYFDETVLDGGPTFYHWEVAADGAVSGTHNRPGSGGTEPIGPLRYAAGARSCGT